MVELLTDKSEVQRSSPVRAQFYLIFFLIFFIFCRLRQLD